MLKHLYLSFLLLLLAIPANKILAKDAIEATIQGAEKTHAAKLAAEREKLIGAFDKQIKKLAKANNLDGALALRGHKDKFEKSGLPPKEGALRTEARAYGQGVLDSMKLLDVVYEEAKNSYTQAVKLDEARSVRDKQAGLRAEMQGLAAFLGTRLDINAQALTYGSISQVLGTIPKSAFPSGSSRSFAAAYAAGTSSQKRIEASVKGFVGSRLRLRVVVMKDVEEVSPPAKGFGFLFLGAAGPSQPVRRAGYFDGWHKVRTRNISTAHGTPWWVSGGAFFLVDDEKMLRGVRAGTKGIVEGRINRAMWRPAIREPFGSDKRTHRVDAFGLNLSLIDCTFTRL